MKIFIAGDSFCSNTTEKSWTKKLEKNIKKSSVKVIGEQGSSLFFTYQNLLKNLDCDYYILEAELAVHITVCNKRRYRAVNFRHL